MVAAAAVVVVVVVTGAGRPEAEVAERVAERRQGQVGGRPFTAALQMPTGLRAGMRERRTVKMARPLAEEVLAGGASRAGQVARAAVAAMDESSWRRMADVEAQADH
jgi:hypothetical protein